MQLDLLATLQNLLSSFRQLLVMRIVCQDPQLDPAERNDRSAKIWRWHRLVRYPCFLKSSAAVIHRRPFVEPYSLRLRYSSRRRGTALPSR